MQYNKTTYQTDLDSAVKNAQEALASVMLVEGIVSFSVMVYPTTRGAMFHIHNECDEDWEYANEQIWGISLDWEDDKPDKVAEAMRKVAKAMRRPETSDWSPADADDLRQRLAGRFIMDDEA